MTCFVTIGDMNVNACQLKNFIFSKIVGITLMLVIFLSCFMPDMVFSQPYLPAYLLDESGKVAKLKSFPSDTAMLPALNNLLETYRQEGYLLASLDSIVQNEQKITAYVYKGNSYDFVFVDWEKFPQDFIVQNNLFKAEGRKFSAKRAFHLINDMLRHAQRTGQPFASIRSDSLGMKDGTIHMRLAYDPGPLVTYDSLVLHGLDKTKTDFIAQYLHLPFGEPYSEEQFRLITSRLNYLSFLKLQRPPTVDFVNEKAIVTLHLKEEKMNTFDGIIGFLQNPGSQRLTITGLVDLALYNLFGTAKELQVSWQQQRELSQTLDMNYLHPRILGSDLSFSMSYGQLKQDTTFINRDLTIGLEAQVKGFVVATSYQRNAGRLLSLSTQEQFTSEIADFNIDFYNLAVGYKGKNSIRQLEFPSWGMEVNAAIGDKRILQNPLVDPELYDTLALASAQYRLGFEGRLSIPFRKKFSVNSRIRARGVYNNQLFVNDLFRLGGLNSLRGFNELEIFANQYVLSNLEIRWQWQEESYFFFFYDQAAYSFTRPDASFSDQPLGLGAGLSLRTDAGLFSLVYALGSDKNQPINLSQAKIHFGFSSRF